MKRVLPIIDLHTCLQGEGKYAGIPNILIRLTGCNLNCMFKSSICDTAYASWRPEKGSFTLQDVIDIVKRNPQINQSFITGGEPTIHGGLLNELVLVLKQYGHFAAIETNGTNEIHAPFDFVTISPKLSNSLPVPGKEVMVEGVPWKVTDAQKEKQHNKRINTKALKQIISTFDYQMKFVVSGVEEINEIKEIQQILNIPSHKIYLMPEGITNEQLQRHRPWVIDTCIKLGYRYSDRLQIIAFGNTRTS